MHRTLVTALALFVSSCGAEMAGTAAVNGVAKAQEAKQAQQTVEQFQKKLDAATHAAQQQANEADKATGYK
jgi:PBP1b-binding outer membrane lipoprotein LpoB